jgi:TRAP transporter 4TM/12TM fusion protein
MLIFLWYPFSAKSPQDRFTLPDSIMALLSLAGGLFFVYDYTLIMARRGEYTSLEIAMGVLTIILVMEGARRATGALLSIIAALALLYAYEGIAPYLPPLFAHKGFDVERIIVFCYTSMDAIFGAVTNVLATYVLPFIILGVFLHKSGIGKFFVDLPYALLGRYPAGTAQVAIVSSALVGMIGSSPTANVVTAGAFTIPLMKKAGYRPEFAGAVEAGSSTGDMFTPPVMGAAAFFMVEFTGIPYIEIIKIAAIPAALYYIGLATTVQVEAAKYNLKGLPRDQLPSFCKVLRRSWFMFAPLFVIIALLVYGFSPQKCAFFACLTCIFVSWFYRESRMGLKAFWSTMTDSGIDMLSIAGVAGAVGIMVGILHMTGLALNLSQIILSLSHGNLFLTVVWAAVASFIVGLAAPISATYVILAVIIPPAMQELGVSVMGAHLLLIWYSQMSGLTPPECMVAYAAAAIAKSDPLKTAIEAMKFSVLVMVIPLLFVYTPILLTGTPFQNVLSIVTSLFGVITFVFVIHRYFIRRNSWLEQILFAAGTFLLFTPKFTWNLVGMAAVLIPMILQVTTRHRVRSLGVTS